MVGGGVHVNAAYADAPYVAWDWGRIRAVATYMQVLVGGGRGEGLGMDLICMTLRES